MSNSAIKLLEKKIFLELNQLSPQQVNEVVDFISSLKTRKSKGDLNLLGKSKKKEVAFGRKKMGRMIGGLSRREIYSDR